MTEDVFDFFTVGTHEDQLRYVLSQFDDHVIEETLNENGFKNYYLHNPEGGTIYSFNVTETPDRLIITGDAVGGCHNKKGFISDIGYTAKWLTGATGSYLCEKFLSTGGWYPEKVNQWLNEHTKPETAAEFLGVDIKDAEDSLEVAKFIHGVKVLLLEDLDSTYCTYYHSENFYEWLTDYVGPWEIAFQIGGGYDPREVENLERLQTVFSRCYNRDILGD